MFLPLLLYTLTLWFGLYLLNRDFAKPGLRYAGLGLVSYAVGLALVLFLGVGQTNIAYFSVTILPALFWMGATFYLVPDAPVSRVGLNVLVALLGLVALAFVLALVNPALAQGVALLIPVAFLIGALLRVGQAFRQPIPRRPLLVLFTATIFFGLAGALIVLPQTFIRQDWVLLAISLDVLLLGVAIAVLDAYDEGTTLLPDVLRSLLAASLGSALFGGQVLAVMVITGETDPALQLLLVGLVTTVVALLAFAERWQSLLDAFIYTQSRVKAEREQLRAAASVAAHTTERQEFAHMELDEFARLTRRAFSYYGDLKRLAASPLIRLPLVTEGLGEGEDNVLRRANVLKRLLRESLEHLKPTGAERFSPAEEWRYYNALYFPYVAGIKPYSRRFTREGLSDDEAAALDWFQVHVPERTLYNWQKAAARLVAQHLQEQMRTPRRAAQ